MVATNGSNAAGATARWCTILWLDATWFSFPRLCEPSPFIAQFSFLRLFFFCMFSLHCFGFPLFEMFLLPIVTKLYFPSKFITLLPSSLNLFKLFLCVGLRTPTPATGRERTQQLAVATAAIYASRTRDNTHGGELTNLRTCHANGANITVTCAATTKRVLLRAGGQQPSLQGAFGRF